MNFMANRIKVRRTEGREMNEFLFTLVVHQNVIIIMMMMKQMLQLKIINATNLSRGGRNKCAFFKVDFCFVFIARHIMAHHYADWSRFSIKYCIEWERFHNVNDESWRWQTTKWWRFFHHTSNNTIAQSMMKKEEASVICARTRMNAPIMVIYQQIDAISLLLELGRVNTSLFLSFFEIVFKHKPKWLIG